MRVISGMTIEGKHTSEFKLRLLSYYIPLPDVNENLIEVPGMSGAIDATEVCTGYPTYSVREGLRFTFKYFGNYQDFELTKSLLAEWIHGKKVKVVLDSDPAFYYVCRLSIDAKKSDRISSTIIVTGYADPMKYEITASDEDWLWDPFDFETGIIRELKDIEVSGNETSITILAGEYSSCPVFRVYESLNLTVSYGGYTYRLPVGDTKIPRIRVGSADVTLVFNGQGKLDISYRGERL